jgi:hypothetical protein
VNWFTDGQKEVALARRKSGPDAPVRWTPAVEPFPQPVPESSRRPGRVGEVFAIAAGRVFLGSPTYSSHCRNNSAILNLYDQA